MLSIAVAAGVLAAPTTNHAAHAASVTPADAGYNPLQHAFEGPQIVFSIVTSQSHHQDRAKAQLETWCAEIHACVFFSDAANPQNDPATYELKLDAMGFEEEKIEKARKDQMRFLGALAKTRELVTDATKKDSFGSVKWVVLCDDETFFFYHNLLKHLDNFDHNKAVYTGGVIPGSEDERGNGIVHIGGGAIFSKAALIQMKNIPDCISKTNLHKPWGTWQSDAIVGECAYEAGILAQTPPTSLFNQIGCSNIEGKAVHHCGKTEMELYDGVSFAKGENSELGFASDSLTEMYASPAMCKCSGHYAQPASIHPVYEADSMKLLYTTFAESSSSNATNVTISKTHGTKIEVMTPEEKKWYDEGYVFGFNKGKAHGEKQGERWERVARTTGEKDGERKGKLQGEHIGLRKGKNYGEQRGYKDALGKATKWGEIRENKRLKTRDADAEHQEGMENRKELREKREEERQEKAAQSGQSGQSATSSQDGDSTKSTTSSDSSAASTSTGSGSGSGSGGGGGQATSQQATAADSPTA